MRGTLKTRMGMPRSEKIKVRAMIRVPTARNWDRQAMGPKALKSWMYRGNTTISTDAATPTRKVNWEM